MTEELKDHPEQIVPVDEKSALRYRVVEEKIDLVQLRNLKDAIERLLAEKEPEEKELAELGKAYHAYYQIDRDALTRQLSGIDALLAKAK